MTPQASLSDFFHSEDDLAKGRDRTQTHSPRLSVQESYTLRDEDILLSLIESEHCLWCAQCCYGVGTSTTLIRPFEGAHLVFVVVVAHVFTDG